MRTWVLLRGLGRDKRHWGNFIEQFKVAFANDKVVTIDTVGNGDFCHLSSPIKISTYTNHCREQLGKIHDDKPIELVALSLGGMVAMDWANRFPQQINSVTLMNTSAANLTPPHKRMKFATLGRLLKAFLVDRSAQAIEQAIVNATSNQVSRQKTIDLWTSYRQQGVTSTLNMIKQLLAAATFKAQAISKSKIVILASINDNIVNHQASKDLQALFNCPMLVHHDAGHDLPLDAADWVIVQIKQQHKIKHIEQKPSNRSDPNNVIV